MRRRVFAVLVALLLKLGLPSTQIMMPGWLQCHEKRGGAMCIDSVLVSSQELRPGCKNSFIPCLSKGMAEAAILEMGVQNRMGML